jgi:hypothetical protein
MPFLKERPRIAAMAKYWKANPSATAKDVVADVLGEQRLPGDCEREDEHGELRGDASRLTATDSNGDGGQPGLGHECRLWALGRTATWFAGAPVDPPGCVDLGVAGHPTGDQEPTVG